MAKWKPPHPRQKKQAPPASKGRLISCLLLLILILFGFYMLLSRSLGK